MKQIDLAYRTLFAELMQRSFDASFDAAFPVTGNFVKVPVDGRSYWYFHDTHAKPARRYVGPVSDPEITKRVNAFKRVKDDFRSRRKLVSTLTREAGLARPEQMTGDVVEALERAGLFRLRCVLVGTVAFQTYPGLLGVRLPGSALQTGDADFAQFHSISTAIEDALPPIIDILKSVDTSFRPVPHSGDPRHSTQYINDTNYKVEFLTPNRGREDYSDKPAIMPALGGTAAQPLRFLDFLIYEPVRNVLLHKGGVPVLVPAPERYAIHKLIVASKRLGDAGGLAKRDKDIHQARLLIEALELSRQQDALALVFAEAWERGPQWRAAILAGMRLFPDAIRNNANRILGEGLAAIGERLEGYPPKSDADAQH